MNQPKGQKPELQMESFHYEPDIKSRKPGVKRVAAYCRVSTLDEQQELSFDTQCSFYEQLIEHDPNMTLVGIYGDQGFSGLRTDQRKEFQHLIADCEAGKIDLVMVKSISRFSRNTVDCIEYLKRLKKIGVTVLFEKEGLNSMDPQTEMILSIYASMAQSESCSHSENVRWARKRRDEVGDPIRVAPYGYRRVRLAGQKKNQWIINEPEAKRVRLIFGMAYQGYSTLEIRNALNRLEETEQTGYIWKKDRLPFILKHEVYRGDLLTSKWISLDYLHPKAIRNRGQADQFYIEQHHEAIVDPEVFDTVQEYFQSGFLNGRMFRRRETWFNEHPEILERREQNNV